MIPLQTKRELACFHCTSGKCGRRHDGECWCECHMTVTDDVAGAAVPAPAPAPAPREPFPGGPFETAKKILDTSRAQGDAEEEIGRPIEMWKGVPHVRGRCPPGATCLACDRIGSHLVPLDPSSSDVFVTTPDGRTFLRGKFERGPVGVPVRITSRKELRENFGSIYGRGSIGALEESVHILLEEQAPVGVTVGQIKRELAELWLKRPKGILARLRWAVRLLLDEP